MTRNWLGKAALVLFYAFGAFGLLVSLINGYQTGLLEYLWALFVAGLIGAAFVEALEVLRRRLNPPPVYEADHLYQPTVQEGMKHADDACTHPLCQARRVFAPEQRAP
jgi:hypothetical protein